MQPKKYYLPLLLFITSTLILYFTSYPTIGWWDSGIYAASANSLSVPDPGGSILFILIGKFFTIIFFFLPKIKAITLVSIISTSAASVFLYYSMLELLNHLNIISDNAYKKAVSFITALSLPFLYSIWAEAIVTRAYALGLIITSVLLFSSIKIWYSENDKEKVKFFFLIIFLMSIDFSAHRLNMPFIPVVLLLLIFRMNKYLLNVKFWMIIIVFVLAGLSIHAFLWIRSSQFSPLNMEDIKSFKDLIAWIRMDKYGDSNFSIIFHRRAPFWDYQIKFMYLRYFLWNFIGLKGTYLLGYFAYFPLALALTGFVYSLVKKIKAWTLIFTIFLFFSFGLIVYANIRAGFDSIREIDRLFIPSFMIFLVWCGIGLFFITGLLSKTFRKIKINDKNIITVLAIIGFLILPINLISVNWNVCNKSGYYFPEDFAHNILCGCEKNAVLFTNGDNDTFPLWYMQAMEGYRKDITVANLGLLNTDFFVNQLIREKNGFNIDSSILSPDKFKPSKIKQLVKIVLPFSAKDSNGTMISDTLIANYNGRTFGKIKGLLVQDKVLLSFLKNNNWKRPVYFCSTVYEGNLLGLNNYLCFEGAVNKLVPFKGDSISIKNLEINLMHKFRYRNFNNRSVYVDRTAKNLFDNYRYAFADLINYYKENGDKQKAERVLSFMRDKLPSWRFSKTQNKTLFNILKKSTL